MHRTATALALLVACSACQGPLHHGQGSLGHDYKAQILLGAMDVERLDVELEPSLGTAVDAEESTFPVFGGAWQLPLREGPAGSDLGFEVGFTWGAKWDSADLVVDTGSGTFAADNDYTLFDLFAGPVLEWESPRNLRAYVGAGPLVQWGRVELQFDDVVGAPADVTEEGLGFGLYARGGVEFYLGREAWFGVGARWIDTELVLDDAVQEVDLDGAQLYASLTFAY